jgi:hypothetical protein
VQTAKPLGPVAVPPARVRRFVIEYTREQIGARGIAGTSRPRAKPRSTSLHDLYALDVDPARRAEAEAVARRLTADVADIEESNLALADPPRRGRPDPLRVAVHRQHKGLQEPRISAQISGTRR